MAADIIPLGAQLRHRRKELGLTQAQAARELDVARTAYRLWELEAARPAPDRWRAIAGWLGITVTALLFAAELLDAEEAEQADETVRATGLSRQGWDARAAASVGDFFQERATIADQAAAGAISTDQASTLRRLLTRIEQLASSEARTGTWDPGQTRKQLANTPLAPAIARTALAATVIGVPSRIADDATLLTSELVTNSVTHTTTSAIELDITLDRERLRIEVADQDTDALRPRTPNLNGGWGLTFMAQLATRWGVERREGGKTVWIEFDLEPSGRV